MREFRLFYIAEGICRIRLTTIRPLVKDFPRFFLMARRKGLHRGPAGRKRLDTEAQRRASWWVLEAGVRGPAVADASAGRPAMGD